MRSGENDCSEAVAYNRRVGKELKKRRKLVGGRVSEERSVRFEHYELQRHYAGEDDLQKAIKVR